MIPMNFYLPAELCAKVPPERRGVRRDRVRLMVLDKKSGRTEHTQFHKLGEHLRANDLIVFNESRTIPASLRGQLSNGTNIEIRLSRQKTPGLWEALPVGAGVNVGESISFSESLSARVASVNEETPFVELAFSLTSEKFHEEIYRIGEPIRYEYIDEPWELDYYQTVFAAVPGSMEMPSAGRAFSWELLFQLKKQGVKMAPVRLHTGLSYLFDEKRRLGPEENEEAFAISDETARAVHETKNSGGRVIAVGTTVVRALETAAVAAGVLRSGKGSTHLHIRPGDELKIVDGLLTGFHEPESSHLDLLSALVNPEILSRAYVEAIEEKYLWHEFGDMNLIV
ncbi:MAG: S-adenosylmethionine:tRNA ribosyltransferase-isomerase [Spirochaetia bacterium]|nr:S-adenosylmethionine:tRNA ribosyltransferase-isomerase [Spirochaetia bacterium]